jgi:hypothetical protein
MHLGVNTHFDQGWPIVALDEAESARAQSIRDTISWGKVEQAPGDYDFTAANSGYVARACAAHMPVLLILTPRNKRYDNGETVFSPLGRRAFAAFAVEIAKRFPCVTGFEIGNEINGHALKGRMVQQMPGSYVAIVREVRAALTGQHAKVKLLSGSSLSVATGFFDRLFGAGLLPLVDGVVIHPYVAGAGAVARPDRAAALRDGAPRRRQADLGFGIRLLLRDARGRAAPCAQDDHAAERRRDRGSALVCVARREMVSEHGAVRERQGQARARQLPPCRAAACQR